ncbi:restriction endonuclease subunit S [[Pasteurella] aerogenes]|nr:restriction endonuclease subunit S [[Pasteurella] aerogenes]
MKKLKDGWRLGKVGDLLFGLESGVSVNGEDKPFSYSDKCVLKVSAVSYGKFDENAAKVIEKKELFRAKINPKAGQIIISRSNTEELVGASAYIEKDYPNLFLPDKLWQTISKPNVNMKWLSYVLASSQVRYTLSKLATGTSSSMKNITQSELLSLKIMIPPLEEQIQIAETLSTWDKAIQTTEKLLENSRRQKKALMQKLLGKGEQIFRLEDLGSTFTGLSGKSKVDFGKGKPYIPYMNIFTNSHIDIQHLELVEIGKDETQNKVRYGDIFFTTSSETPDEVGMSSVLLNEVDELYLNSFCFGFRLNNFENLLPEYAQYLFRCDEIRKAISLLGQGATRYNLSKTQLMKLTIKLPSLEEQREIAEILSIADQEIETLQRKLECLKLEKGALTQKLLEGDYE